MLDFITWTADPAIFSIGSREIRWYGLAFAIGFLIGYKIMEKMWKREKLNPAWIDSHVIFPQFEMSYSEGKDHPMLQSQYDVLDRYSSP